MTRPLDLRGLTEDMIRGEDPLVQEAILRLERQLGNVRPAPEPVQSGPKILRTTTESEARDRATSQYGPDGGILNPP